MRLIPILAALFLALPLVALAPVAPAQAQEGLFSPRVFVNGRAVTRFEHDQRRRFLELLRAPGDPDELAEVALIEDRLRMDAADALGLALTEEQLRAGMEEFAARANLSADEFVTALGQGGVAAETFRDFVEAGLVWRDVIRARFGPSIQISDAEIDRALALSSQRGLSARVLVSEMVVQAPSQIPEESLALAERIAGSIGSAGGFAAAARANSTSDTAEAGGELDWMSQADLPPAARAGLTGLRPGQVSKPIRVANGYALFFLRDLREPAPTAPEGPYIEYAEFLIPGGPGAQSEAAAIAARVDVCADLYKVAQGLPEDRLTITSRPQSQLPADVASQVETLDEGESTTLTRGGAVVFLMLCKRQAGGPQDMPSREAMRNQLTNERLNALSESYMADLRADAIIRYP